MFSPTRSSALALALISPALTIAGRAQSAPARISAPTLVTHNTDLPSAPEPQTQSPQAEQKRSQPTAPSLQDLGLSPEQTRADLDAQHRLDRRTHDLKVHQTLGLITLLPIAAACLTSGLAPPDPRSGNNEIGRDIHVALGSAR